MVGDGLPVACVDGQERPYLSLDAAASTSALPAVAQAVHEFLPWYSSVHRGAGHKSQRSTAAYEEARAAALRFAGRPPDGDDVAIICRNTTEAINHLAYRLDLTTDDVVVTTVVEHHANLLPWARICRRRYVECSAEGTFTVDDVAAVLDDGPRPRLVAVTGASNVTGWLPPIDGIIAAAHDRGRAGAGRRRPARRPPPPPVRPPTSSSGAATRCTPRSAPGVLIGPRAAFAEGDPFLAGGGAVDLVDLDEVAWTDPPDREEAGSPNVIGAVALRAAIDELGRIGWDAIAEHDSQLHHRMRTGLAAIPGVSVLGPEATGGTELPLVTFTVAGVPHALVAARLSAEHAIGVRHGCFCAHPYLVRLLGLTPHEIARHWDAVRHRDRHAMPGAIRASAGLSTSTDDIDRLVSAVADIASGRPAPVAYHQDPTTGDFHIDPTVAGPDGKRAIGASCARG